MSCHPCFGRGAQERQDFWKAPRDGAETDEREVVNRIEARDAFCRHFAAAHPCKAHPAVGAQPQCAHQRGAESIARLLGGDEKDVEEFRWTNGPRTHPPAACSRRPRTNSRARSAMVPMRSGSATIVLPATTAMPARPARAAPSTVCGPIEGKSTRRSWSRLAALTSTPRPAAAAMHPL